MSQSYSQARAFAAIVKAALRSIIKSPSSVIFTLAFPLIFILVFGFLGDRGAYHIDVGLQPGSDTANAVYAALRQSPLVRMNSGLSAAELDAQLKKGSLQVLVGIASTGGTPQHRVTLKANAADGQKAVQVKALVEQAVLEHDKTVSERHGALIEVKEHFVQRRKFSAIDFILPGQLGFSLLAASVFGTAFVFFNLRQALVLKRFFATPVRREYIILAEGCARMAFQLLGALFIILVGRVVFGFTLVHGVLTVLNMLLVCALGLLVFMSFGFVISGLAKSESLIPPLSNLLTLPQFLLAGTFFSVDAFPSWLQPVSRALPLTYLNDALREIAFDGASLWDVKLDLLILLLWGAAGYAVASRVFRWE